MGAITIPARREEGVGRPREEPRPRRTVCRICAGGVAPGHSMCTSCRDVAVALGRPPVPVTPITLVTASSPLYRALRQYKSGEPGVAIRQAARLARLLDRYFTRHLDWLAPDGLDLSVVVPSPRDGRPPPHPLTTLMAGSTLSRLVPHLADALSPGTSPVAHRRPSRDGYRAKDGVFGKRVLLVDDVYTSGAHLQSAAAALDEAGACSVHAVVLGRFVHDHHDHHDQERCARCQP